MTIAWFKGPVVTVTLPVMPNKGLTPAPSFKTCKYYNLGASLVMCNPDFTEAVMKIDATDANLATIRADPAITELTEAQAVALIQSWYPGYAFSPQDFSLRKVPSTYGISVRTLKDVLTMSLISYDGMPHLARVGEFTFWIKITIG